MGLPVFLWPVRAESSGSGCSVAERDVPASLFYAVVVSSAVRLMPPQKRHVARAGKEATFSEVSEGEG